MTIRPSIIERIDRAAEHFGLTRSEAVNRVLNCWTPLLSDELPSLNQREGKDA